MRKSKKTHYETLGVEPDATEADIKKAYINKAHQTHPDKNPDKADGAEFAEVNEAYTILGDTGRRQLYDATGRDDRTPMEQTVQSELMKAFSAALSLPDEDKSVVETVRGAFKRAIEQIAAERENIDARRKSYEVKRNRIETTNEVNLVHLLIDEEFGRMDNHLASLDHQEECMNACLLELDAYSEKIAKKLPIIVFPTSATLGDLMRIDPDPFGGNRW